MAFLIRHQLPHNRLALHHLLIFNDDGQQIRVLNSIPF